ncbi:MAG: DUF3450 domain-containing protein [Xanthomonadales bacterium]|nr:DUF3450 domain-containing protein [Xanthomonadales bacterium]
MLLLGATLSVVFSASVFAQATVEQVMAEGEKRADAGAAEQRRIEQIADQTANLLNDYNTVAKVVDGLVTYNALLQRQIDNQEQEMAALEESIKNVALIERQIIPMMTRMLDSLEVFIDLDTPFLVEERHERLERLRGMMERSDVSAAEKFRRVVEAFQIENDYGRTIEAYKHTVMVDGKEVEADFLRVGRISLAYQTVGGGTTGAWDKEAGQFVKLDDAEFKNQVSHGLKVARKQVAPDLLVVPVFAPEGE